MSNNEIFFVMWVVMTVLGLLFIRAHVKTTSLGEKIEELKKQLGHPIQLGDLPFGEYQKIAFYAFPNAGSYAWIGVAMLRDVKMREDVYWLVYTDEELPPKFFWNEGRPKVAKAIPEPELDPLLGTQT